ncbi:NAD(P)/FAD-dependent oxidoreductase [Fluviispira multicolorata]|uniref:Ferredoxin--NADP reductase n=1 Tax=Fluviispira multicolorata TaxID=2654512 RepID=A0A833JF44_9BACT|nr:NAD(P)/FAD-dependent oxidoreductase [Fluviispira multicolorata]KAB8033539.1 SidA/IucD/PvdA family monooxygenase [Fluviispira multicolorata]
MSSKVYDILILGGGPTGLFAAFYAGMRNASCKIVDSMPALGGRLTAVYPEKFIYDVAGFPKILAKDLVDNLIEQIKPYQTEICLNETSQSLVRNAEGIWELTTHKDVHLAKTIIIAAGVGSYSPKKHQAIGSEKFEDKGISYAVIEKSIYKNRNVVIAGGGDSALDWANEFVNIAKSVTLVHRSDKFRAHDDSVSKLQKTNARVILNSEVTEFLGNEKLEKIHIKGIENDLDEIIQVDDALIMFGFNSSLGKIKEWGLELVGNGICVNEKMETNLPGIFAAGDIAKYAAKLDLIVTGFSEAAIAVAFAKIFINPKEKAQPMHSTTLMEIKEKKEKRLNKI